MSNTGFGERLRREREMRGVSLEEIAGATRISTRFLDALEKEAWDRLPGGVFNRGFVRTVARFLGLEEESLLAEYALATGLPRATPVPSEMPPQPSASRKAPRVALAMAALLALAAGGWPAWRWISARRAELIAATNTLPAAPAPPTAPPNLWIDPSDPAAPPLGSAESASPWSGQTSDLQLKIDAAKETSLTVTSDGQQAFAGTMLAGESRKVSARTVLTVDTQDAGAIHLELNGQALPPIGPPGRPGSITLGPSNAKTDGGHD